MIGAVKTAPIMTSNLPAFTLVDTSGNTLHFDGFAYERSVEAAHGEYTDANWLRLNITLHATIRHTVRASMLTTELQGLADALRVGATRPPDNEALFEPLEPYLELRVSRYERIVNVTARLDLAPALGPVIEFNYECRPEEIEATLAAISEVQKVFAERTL